MLQSLPLTDSGIGSSEEALVLFLMTEKKKGDRNTEGKINN